MSMNSIKTQSIAVQFEAQQIHEQSNGKAIVRRTKKYQPLPLFWACIISLLMLAALNFPIFFSGDVTLNAILMGIFELFSYISFITNSCMLADSKKDLCGLYFVIDTIFLSLSSALVGVVGMQTIVTPPDSYIILFSTFYTFSFFLLAGNFKIILAYCQYSRWQVIVCKLSLALSCLSFLILGAYFMKNSFENIPISEEEQDPLQEFFFLYIFGLFTLYFELFSRMSDLDGTSELQYHYQMNDAIQSDPLKREKKEREEKEIENIQTNDFLKRDD